MKRRRQTFCRQLRLQQRMKKLQRALAGMASGTLTCSWTRRKQNRKRRMLNHLGSAKALCMHQCQQDPYSAAMSAASATKMRFRATTKPAARTDPCLWLTAAASVAVTAATVLLCWRLLVGKAFPLPCLQLRWALLSATAARRWLRLPSPGTAAKHQPL